MVGLWKRRWFVLKPDSLLYFHGMEDEIPRGVIPLSQCQKIEAVQSSRGGKNATMALTVPGRTYTLAADSEDKQLEWISVVEEAMAMASDANIRGSFGNTGMNTVSDRPSSRRPPTSPTKSASSCLTPQSQDATPVHLPSKGAPVHRMGDVLRHAFFLINCAEVADAVLANDAPTDAVANAKNAVHDATRSLQDAIARVVAEGGTAATGLEPGADVDRVGAGVDPGQLEDDQVMTGHIENLSSHIENLSVATSVLSGSLATSHPESETTSMTTIADAFTAACREGVARPPSIEISVKFREQHAMYHPNPTPDPHPSADASSVPGWAANVAPLHHKVAMTLHNSDSDTTNHSAIHTVIPGLCLGSAVHLQNQGNSLREQGVTAIISLMDPTWKPECVDLAWLEESGSRDHWHMYVPVQDVSEAEIASKLLSCSDFIGAHEKVFVHCMAGVSRSATVCIAHVMRHHHLGFPLAYAVVKSARKVIRPNNGFCQQLVHFGRTLC